MSEVNSVTGEAGRTGVRIGQVADTLETLYLRNALEALSPEWRTAVDIGAGGGDASAEMLARGLRVLAIDESPAAVATLRERFPMETRDRRFQAESSAGADGGIAGMLAAHGFREIGFARVASEGLVPALRALLARRGEVPAIVTFRVPLGLADLATTCLALLRSRGYCIFDAFLKRGVDPICAERFGAVDSPIRRFRGGSDYSASFVAYHASGIAAARSVSPGRFLSDYQILNSQHLLRLTLREEARAAQATGLSGYSAPGALAASRIRSELRFDILAGGWANFLGGRIGRHLGAQTRLGGWHEGRRSALAASPVGRQLIEQVGEPPFGAAPAARPGAAGRSVPMTGTLYDMMRVNEFADGRWPRRVVEVSAGWGVAAYVHAAVVPNSAYAIIDHPEALAVQHYFLTLSLPHLAVTIAQDPEVRPTPGTILLVPPNWLRKVPPGALNCDLLFGTKMHEQLAPSLRAAIKQSRGFGAANTYFSGDWTFEGEEQDVAVAA